MGYLFHRDVFLIVFTVIEVFYMLSSKAKKKENVSGYMPEKNGLIGRDFFFREALPCKKFPF